MFVNRSGQNEQSLERTLHRCFLPSFSSFGWEVSEEKIKMWKVNGRRTQSNGKSSHCLWQGELTNYVIMFARVLRQVGGFHLCLQLFVGGLMSYLRYLCLLARSGVHAYCVFLSSSSVPCCQFLWIVHFWSPLRYSLMLIY
jgi:hypothetical protein